jgi:hypothetical protein
MPRGPDWAGSEKQRSWRAAWSSRRGRSGRSAHPRTSRAKPSLLRGSGGLPGGPVWTVSRNQAVVRAGSGGAEKAGGVHNRCAISRNVSRHV